MSVQAFIKAAPRGLLISFAVAFALLNGLGVWQLYRLHWKEQLIAEMARTEAMPPLPAAILLTDAKPQWRSVILPTCRPDPRHALYMHSEVNGVPGYRVLVACPTGMGQDMLVDLGFVREKLSALPFDAIAPVGRLRPADKPSAFAPVNNPAAQDWYARSAAEMGAALGTQVRPDYFLVLDLQASHLENSSLLQGPLTAPLSNRHLEYALTWFGLAWVMAGIVFAMIRQRMTASKSSAKTPHAKTPHA